MPTADTAFVANSLSWLTSRGSRQQLPILSKPARDPRKLESAPFTEQDLAPLVAGCSGASLYSESTPYCP